MAHSNIDTIELRSYELLDGRKTLKGLELYVDGCKRASAAQRPNGTVKFHFNAIGTFDLQEAQAWLQGLLELSIAAEELVREKKK